jgi:predicted ABC-type ATPase
MNVDRIPDDPVPDAETARLTDSPRTDAPRPTPEPEHPSPPEQRQPPDREPEPERESHDEQQEPENEHRPESPTPPNDPDAPAPTDSPSRPTSNAPDTADAAEPRSRQEHAAPDGPAQEEENLTEETKSSEVSNPPHEQVPSPDSESSYDHPADYEGEAAEAFPPHTQEERAEHIIDVFTRLDKADDEGFSSIELYTIDPKGEIWSSDRTLLHHSLLEEVYSKAADVPCDHKAIVAGGLSGAGKTTVLANHPEIDRSNYLTINPDDIKEEMAQHGMIPEVEGLSPMEASELVHEESSYLARQLALRAQADGKNLIWDITMSDKAKTEQRITELRESGYTRVDALFVQISIETSLRRTEARYWEDQDKWFEGEGLGGRLIPPEVILRQADDEWGSGNRKTFEAIKEIVDSWEIHDNSTDDQPARLLDRRKHEEIPSTKPREQGL